MQIISDLIVQFLDKTQQDFIFDEFLLNRLFHTEIQTNLKKIDTKIKKFEKKYPYFSIKVLKTLFQDFLTYIHPKDHFQFPSGIEGKDAHEIQFTWPTRHALTRLIRKFWKNALFQIYDWKLVCLLSKNDFRGSEKTSPKKYFILSDISQAFQLKKKTKTIILLFEFRCLTDDEKEEYWRNYQRNILKKIFSKIYEIIKKNHDLFQSVNSDIYYKQIKKYLTNYTKPHYKMHFYYPNVQNLIQNHFTKFLKNKLGTLFVDNPDLISEVIDNNEFYPDLYELFICFFSLIIDLEQIKCKIFQKPKIIYNTQFGMTFDKITSSLHPVLLQSSQLLKFWQSNYGIKHDFLEKITKSKKISNLIVKSTLISRSLRYSILSQIKDYNQQLDAWLFKGDNFHCMELLKPRFTEQFAVIYIDPPYNTGTRDFSYQDTFDRPNWLSLMESRLNISRHFLKSDGIFFSSIDDNQLASYALLIEQCFPERLENIVWHKKTQPSYLSKELIPVTEYIITAKKQKDPLKLMGSFGNPKKLTEMINIGNKKCERVLPKESVLIGDHFSGILEKKSYGRNKLQIKILEHPVKVKNGKPCSDLHLYGRFKWTQDRINEEIQKGGKIYIKSIKTLRPTIDRKYDQPIVKAPITLLSKKLNDIPTNTDANAELKSLFNIPPFDYSKPTDLIQYLIRAGTYYQPGGWVLDFFAGSGSTAQAVMEQNAIDSSRRKYILIEQSAVFDHVLIPRIEKLMFASEWKAGQPLSDSGHSHFYKSSYIEDVGDTYLNLEISLFRKSSEKQINSRTLGEFFFQFLPSNTPNSRNIFQESTYLYYQIEITSKNPIIKFNTPNFETPFSYFMYFTINGIIKKKFVDLIETFNYLMGFVVIQYHYFKHQDRWYCILEVLNKTDNNKKSLVIWRNTQELEFKIELDYLQNSFKFANYSQIFANVYLEYLDYTQIEKKWFQKVKI